jgi:hypothetical protein
MEEGAHIVATLGSFGMKEERDYSKMLLPCPCPLFIILRVVPPFGE